MKAADVAYAIDQQLTGSTVTAGVDSTGHITFTDANQTNAAPTVTGLGDALGVLSSPSSVSFATTFGGATFDLTGSKAASFTVSDGTTTKTITIDAAVPKSGTATLGNTGTNAVSSADVLDSINTQFGSNSPFKAYVDTNGKLNIVGTATAAGAVSITGTPADTTGAAVFTSTATSSGAGTSASSTATTASAPATTTATNVAVTLGANSFGTGGHTTFQVGGTSIMIDANSAYDSTACHTLSQDPSKLTATINKQLTDAGNTSVQATTRRSSAAASWFVSSKGC